MSTLGVDGAGVPAKGLTAEDYPFAWTSDARAVVVALPTVPARIERVDPLTGERAAIKELMPSDRAGVNNVVPSQWIDDGRGYLYTYSRELTRLFVASGVGR